ncbi:MAG TPA: hypothetical protein VM580_14065 [Labilithrix sp.]|nr:hypothetical protein [Labilithrix sp.]
MIGFEIGCRSAEELLRFLRALGQHRYVASRLHLVHAFAIEAAAEHPALAEAAAWARRTLDPNGGIDLASKDERLHRRASDAELAGLLETFWVPGDASEKAKARLRERLASIDALPQPSRLPFEEEREEDVFPVLVDAGWELLPLAHLDFERHRGAIAAFDDFEVARFEEESAIPPIVTLHELPVFGGVELLAAFDDAAGAEERRTRAPFVLWQQGAEPYVDYVLRGVLRASKISIDED